MEYEELIPSALAGDQDAYAEIFRQLTPLVRSLSRRYFHGTYQGDDFEADCLAHILLRLDQFKGESKFTTWATRVSINHALGIIRINRILTSRFISMDQFVDGSEMTHANNIPDPHDYFAMPSNDDQRAKEILAALPPHHREVMILKHFNGLKNREIQAHYGLNTINAGKSKVFHAHRFARRHFKKETIQ